MGLFDYLIAALQKRGDAFAGLGEPFSLVSLLGAALIIACLFFRRRRARSLPVNFIALLCSIFPRRIILHPSTRVDFWMFVTNAVLLGGAYGMMIVTSPFWRQGMLAALHAALGPHEPWALPDLVILAVVTPVELLAIELGYWLAHYLMHRIPVLWQFHKVHHSAEVMTPLTEWRQHPVEMLLFPNLIGMMTGLAYGVLVYVLGDTAQPLSLWHVNVLFLVFFLTISHLRHSHVWLPLTGFLGRLIHSPAHHQIHHSTQVRHFDKNLGFSLSVWDWVFGTLFVPARRESLTFGIGAEGADHSRIDRSFALPFVRIWQMWRK